MLWRIIALILLLFGSFMHQSAGQPLPDHLTPFLDYMFGDGNRFKVRYHSKSSTDFPKAGSWGDDGFGVKAKGFRIDIFGNTALSRQYATYHLLEQHFGCLYLSAADFGYNITGSADSPLPEAMITSISGHIRPEHIPRGFWDKGTALLKKISISGLPELLIDEVPAFSYREILYGEARRGRFAVWNGLDVVSSEDPVERHPGWGLWVHTMHRLISPDQYFNSHPEYFALRNGIRLKDQVCLSNPDVMAIVTANLRTEMGRKPEARFWSVSQMDNFQYCECELCAAIDKAEGSNSGSIIRFVNALADSFPEKVISTLAYQYSRKAPKLTKPRPNVNIMLCSIECDRARPIRGDGFEKDLADWSSMTRNIIIWDYVINFHHFLMPFPNWPTLGPNLRLFQEYGVPMIFEQGYNSPASEFQPLRNWLLSKLLWNPQADHDSLIKVFLDGYYGEAGAHISSFINLQINALQEGGGHLSLYEPPIVFSKSFLKPELLDRYDSLMDLAAKSTSESSIFRHRVHMVRQYINYSRLEISKYSELIQPPLFLNADQIDGTAELNPTIVNPFYSDLLEEVRTTCNKYGPPLMREVYLSPDDYSALTIEFWSRARCEHKGKGKAMMYLNPPDAAYRAGALIPADPGIWLQNQPLLDGRRGWHVYQTAWQGWWGRDAAILIDLGKVDTISSVTINYLENNQSWIVGPSAMKACLSILQPTLPAKAPGTDALQQNFDCEAINPFKGMQLPQGIHSLKCALRSPTPARYIYLEVTNPGQLPAWRGVDGNGWLFLDEVEVF